MKFRRKDEFVERTCDKPHYPYQLPKGWVWCKLEDIASIGTGATPLTKCKEYYLNGNIPWVNSSSTKDSVIESPSNYITSRAIQDTNCVVYPKGTLIVAMYGEGKTRGQVSELGIEAATNQACAAICPFEKEFKNYLKLFFESNYLRLRALAEGGTQPNLNLGKISNYEIPLPPLEEQCRIFTKIKHWISLIDVIENGKWNINETIKQAKSKILNLAIHGKLVPQDPTDEPAYELLKRINPKAEITCDNPHYRNLPKGWAVIKVGNVAKYTNGRAFKPEEWESTGLPIIRIQNLNDADAPYNRSSVIHEQKYLIKDGDLLFAWAASIGTYIWSGENAWLNQHIFKVEPYPFIDKAFLFYAFQAMISEFYKNSHGSGMVHITKKQFEEITLLLPPLSEQIRIVECLEQTFSILDSINCNL